MRDSLVFYRSFAEAIRCLPEEDQLAAFWNIVDYALDGKEPDGSGAAMAIFRMARPQIDKNNVKYENGSKGGRPKEEGVERLGSRNSADYQRWKYSVYQRDGYKCVCCGATDDICAHHIKGYNEYPELRYDVSNGVTLCRRCHGYIHGNDEKKKAEINRVISELNLSKTESNLKETECKPNVNVNVNDNVNDKRESKREKFTPPTPEQVKEYAEEKGYAIDAERFVDFYQSKGWKVGKDSMKDWKAAVRNWSRSEKPARKEETAKPKRNIVNDFDQRDIDYDALERELLQRSYGGGVG